MAPLFPDLVSNELNVVSGLLVGILFGAVLEQAGFGSSRRLAGLFYGYDFTVLRVFFTAALTAIAGSLLLASVGLLDLDAVFVNPLFVWPAIGGGLLMGLGFVLGGYCPGTAVCGAAIGKRDGLAFLLGGVAGVFAYGEAYPWLAGFVNGSARGPLRVYDSLGTSRGLFVLLLTVAAIGAFAAAGWLERRVSRTAPSFSFPRAAHRVAAAVTLVIALALYVLPERRARLLAEVAGPEYRRAHSVRTMTSEELAFRLIDRDARLQIVDLRSEREYQAERLPGSVNVPLEGLLSREWRPLLARRDLTRVFVDEDGTGGRQAALLATRLGDDDARVLDGGLAALRRDILSYAVPVEDASARALTPAEQDARRFRAFARTELARLVAEAGRGPATPKKGAPRIKGGC